MKKLLLHACCGPCASGSIDRLLNEYAVVLFWSNCNIFPKEEYDRRLTAAKTLAEKKGLKLIEDAYCHDTWLKSVRGLEKEPERGKRCPVCFEFSLRRTAAFAVENKFDCFTTTLTISPHKNSKTIFEIGKTVSDEFGIKFIEKDFKKQDGFKKSLDISSDLRLYRQNYCGCEFSNRNIASPKE